MTRPHRGVLLVVAALVAAGCSLGSRQAMADTVIKAADVAAALKTVTGRLSASVEPVKTKRPPRPGPPRVLPISATGLSLVSDLSTGTTFIGGAGQLGGPTLVFSGSTVFQRRGTVPSNLQVAGSAAATNLIILGAPVVETVPTPGKPTPRPWVKMDYDRLPRTSQERTAGSLGLDPGKLVRLLRGALAGSLENVGREEIEGAPATHYTMNVSREKATRGLPNRERIRLEKVFAANAVDGDISKAEVWIGDDGRPRRILARLRQRVDSVTQVDLVVTLDISGYGDPVTTEPPKKREVATVTSFGQLVHAATGV
jgi:hypothetical protein